MHGLKNIFQNNTTFSVIIGDDDDDGVVINKAYINVN